MKNFNEITTDKLFNNKITIMQYKKGYRFSIDSPVLADFVYEEEEKIYLDVGTGSGIIPILMSYFDKNKNNIKKIYAIEIQKSLYDLAIKNFEINSKDYKRYK